MSKGFSSSFCARPQKTTLVQGLARYRRDLSTFDGRTKLVLLTAYSVEVKTNQGQPEIWRRWYEVGDLLDSLLRRGLLRNRISRFLTKQFLEYLNDRRLAMSRVGRQLVPGVNALCNLLIMLDEAINNCQRKLRVSSAYEYVGFYIDGTRQWVGVYYDTPAILTFETYHMKLDLRKAKKLHKGHLEDRSLVPGGKCWVNEFDLRARNGRFFRLSQTGQVRRVEAFVKESLAAADKIQKQR